MKGYNMKRLRCLLNEKENELDELNKKADEIQELLILAKHPNSKMASIPVTTEENLVKTLNTINKKCDTLTLIITCVKDNISKIKEAKNKYEEIYKCKYNDSMYFLENIKI